MKNTTKTFSEAEREAMKERAEELKTDKADGERVVLAKIAAMPEPDRSLAKRFHEIVKINASTLTPKTWYGMPAYANKEGKIICFFQNASKFKYRYSTLGFSDAANLDDGEIWPTAFALKKLTAVEETKIAALLKKAVS